MQTKKNPASTSSDLYKKTSCRYCRSSLPPAFLDLGNTALANSFLTQEEAKKPEFTCPLRLCWCSNCGLVQLSDVVPADKMFSNYLYVSSTTKTFQTHFAQYARSVQSKLAKKEGGTLAVDIGSNDGLLLDCYQREGMKAVGIEPARNLSREANDKGLTTLHDYFGKPAVDKILKEWGPSDVVSANNVFAHMDDIPSVCENVNRLLGPQGIFVIEFPYLKVMIEQMLFDMIYHEHLSYISVSALQFVLKRFDLEIFQIQPVASHGGSLRTFIQKKNGGRPITNPKEFLDEETRKGYHTAKIYQDFSGRVQAVKNDLVKFVKQAKSEGKTLSGYGAPAKGNTLINFCRWTASDIGYIVDDNPLKQNRLTPGARIPVVNSRHLFEHPTDYVILFAWNFADEILKKLEPLKKRGVQFVVPLPRPRVMGAS